MQKGQKKAKGIDSENYTTRTTSSSAIIIFLARILTRCRATGTRHHGATSLLFLRKAIQSLHDTQLEKERTLLYFLISRTRLLKASSTLILCFADVSINLHPKCLAKSRPSEKLMRICCQRLGGEAVPFMPT